MSADQVNARQCLDCGARLDGPYCAACGQRAGPARTTLRALLGEVFGEVFELDGRVPRTLIPFVTRPGFLTAEYNAGRRRRYTSPLRLLLGMGVMWVLATFALGQLRPVDPAETEGWTVSLADPDDPGAIARMLGLEGTVTGDGITERVRVFEALPEREQVRRVRTAAVETVPTVALALLPVFTLVLKLLFLGSGRTIPEHAIFALHLHAFALLVFIVLRIAGGVATANLVGFGVLAIYTTLALRRAYALSWPGTLLRAVVLGVGAVTVGITGTAIAVIGSALAG